MTPRIAHAHDIITNYHWDDRSPTWEYWDALQTIINAPAKDWNECDETVKAAARTAVHNNDLDSSDNVPALYD